MTLFEPCDEKFNDKPAEGHFVVIGYREYANTNQLRYIDENSKQFRKLVHGLKDGAEGPMHYFGELLNLIFDEVIQDADLIACVPGSKKTSAVRNDPIARMIREGVAKSHELIDGTSFLQRLYDVPKAHEDPSMRKYSKQLESISRSAMTPAGLIDKILLVDDVYTSGSTMAACYTRLKEAYPEAEILGFAFGVTQRKIKSPSPEVPRFPMRHEPLARIQSHLDDLQLMAPQSHRYGSRPRFVMNGLQKRIHKATCSTVRGAARPQPLKSLREGLLHSDMLCQNCMY